MAAWDSPTVEDNRVVLGKPFYDVQDPNLSAAVEVTLYKLQANIIQLINNRCQPLYKKDATQLVGYTTEEEWKIFIDKLNISSAKSSRTERFFRKPTFFGFDLERHQTIRWKGEDNIPPLLNQPRWYRIKWRAKNEHYYRASLVKLSITRNSMNGIVKVHFSYYTERFKPHRNAWEPV